MPDPAKPLPPIRHTDSLEDASLVLQHRQLKERFDNHLSEYDNHRAQLCLDYESNMSMITANTENTTANTAAITNLAASTKVLVEAVGVVNSLQRFAKWISSFTILVVAGAWAITKLPDAAAYLLKLSGD